MTYRASPLARAAMPHRTPWWRIARAWADGTLADAEARRVAREYRDGGVITSGSFRIRFYGIWSDWREVSMTERSSAKRWQRLTGRTRTAIVRFGP